MQKEELLAKITGIMQKITSNPNLHVTEETRFEDIEDWDSLNTVDMEMDLESTLSISFEIGEFRELDTISALLDCLAQKLK